MKISVITVAYNSAATIGDTMQSVASQTHADIEHVVIDGASSDDTLTVVRRHGSHVAKLVSESDRGIYDAMNKGLRLVTGDLVGFLNADDTFADDAVLASIAAAAEDPSVDAVYGDLVYVKNSRPDETLRYWRSGPFVRSSLRRGWMPPHPTLYVRRSRIGELGPFDCSFKVAADYDFVLRYLMQPDFRAAYVPKVLVRMRTGGASNRSVAAIIDKSREDLRALRSNHVGGSLALLCKNVRKLPQFFSRPVAAR